MFNGRNRFDTVRQLEALRAKNEELQAEKKLQDDIRRIAQSNAETERQLKEGKQQLNQQQWETDLKRAEELNLAKTKPCIYAARGNCIKGKWCSFLHPEDALHARPEKVPDPRKKTVPCRNWNGDPNSCPYGDKCDFLHADEQDMDEERRLERPPKWTLAAAAGLTNDAAQPTGHVAVRPTGHTAVWPTGHTAARLTGPAARLTGPAARLTGPAVADSDFEDYSDCDDEDN